MKAHQKGLVVVAVMSAVGGYVAWSESEIQNTPVTTASASHVGSKTMHEKPNQKVPLQLGYKTIARESDRRALSYESFLKEFEVLEEKVLRTHEEELSWKELLLTDAFLEKAYRTLESSADEEERFTSVRFLAESMAIRPSADRIDYFFRLLKLFVVPSMSSANNILDRQSILADRLELYALVRSKVENADELLLRENSNSSRFLELAKKWSGYRFGRSS